MTKNIACRTIAVNHNLIHKNIEKNKKKQKTRVSPLQERLKGNKREGTKLFAFVALEAQKRARTKLKRGCERQATKKGYKMQR